MNDGKQDQYGGGGKIIDNSTSTFNSNFIEVTIVMVKLYPYIEIINQRQFIEGNEIEV